jgi:hypothetical protein
LWAVPRLLQATEKPTRDLLSPSRFETGLAGLAR